MLVADDLLDLIMEEAEKEDNSNKSSIINYITSNFYKAINADDNRKVLLLIAAISMLSTSNDQVSINAARKLAQMSVPNKKKEIK